MQRLVEPQRRVATRIEWTSRVIPHTGEMRVHEMTGVKTPVFEELLNNAFAELYNDGYHVTAVQPYPDGFVVIANRMRTPTEMPGVVRDNGAAELDFIYSWQEYGSLQQQSFPTLNAALGVAAAHFKDSGTQPVALHQRLLTSYNAIELKELVTTI